MIILVPIPIHSKTRAAESEPNVPDNESMIMSGTIPLPDLES